MKEKIISETPMTMNQVREELDKIKAKEKELNYRAQKTEDYLQRFASLKSKEHQALLKKLADLGVPRLREQHLAKLADVLPTAAKDVKTVLQGYAVTLTNENAQKIADTIKECVK